MILFSKILVLLAVVTFLPRTGFSDEDKKLLPGRVLNIVDGDTIHFGSVSERAQYKIRMVGIDAPETHLVTDHGIVGQGYWGHTATKYLESLVPVKTKIYLERLGEDKYGRTLGRLFYHDLKNEAKPLYDVNLVMAQSGWAVPYVICTGSDCEPTFFARENVASYLRACVEARAAGRGIYNPSRPLKEMPFEFRLRMQKRKPDKYVGDFATKKYYEPSDYKKVDLCKRIFFMTREDAQNAGFDRAN